MMGVIVLYAMWLVHVLLFRGASLANWIGLIVVVQNSMSSLFNSHLFDFVEGWIYVLGVGVAGGMALAAGPSRLDPAALPRPSCWQAMRRTAGTAAGAVAALPTA